MSKKQKELIEKFMSVYAKEYDYYYKLSSEISREIEVLLSEAGVRAIVSFRAKGMESLERKLQKRNIEGNGKKYDDLNDIYNDMVDLAGVRVALYFPGDIEKVTSIIRGKYNELKCKDFPDISQKKDQGVYFKRFDGYHARHFRITRNDSSRYADTPVEVQVASVLMHAWSEVEHDLVYKPMSGGISKEELMILDEINGMVISGNIALERLQSAIIDRVNEENYIFQNHYDLAAALLNKSDFG
ncbi:RelA/SpoT domain-containing protein [Enterobacter soli]|uniref:GTP pyrophosphokinase n=1 Tax=Enterobacter soli TaxID=885040 RepID=UPI002F42979B